MEAARPLRADARRNRERVLDAARASFREYGRNAQMDDVARRAGVGVGTVYRHFPDKAALVEALVSERFREFAEDGRRALEEEDDVWEAFTGWLMRCGEWQESDRAFCEYLTNAVPHETKALVAEREGLQEVDRLFIEKGKRAGVIRDDARPDDIPLIMAGIAATARTGGIGNWRRHLHIALDGLRSASDRKLPD
ncbi:MAG TPA: helix-turn-helix domain-containing protein [Thermoleophilaceae bacterium]|jgi:AcrR family transcriptional regulator